MIKNQFKGNMLFIRYDKSLKNYSPIPHHFFNDPDLFPLSKLLLTYLIMKNENWILNRKVVQKFLDVGENKYQQIIKNLLDTGYVEKIKERNIGSNKFTYTYTINEMNKKTSSYISTTSNSSASNSSTSISTTISNNKKEVITNISNINNIYSSSSSVIDNLIDIQNELSDDSDFAKIEKDKKEEKKKTILEKLEDEKIFITDRNLRYWHGKIEDINQKLEIWYSALINPKIKESLSIPANAFFHNNFLKYLGELPDWVKDIIPQKLPERKYISLFNIFHPEGIRTNDIADLINAIYNAFYFQKYKYTQTIGKTSARQFKQALNSNLYDLIKELLDYDINSIKNNASIKQSIIESQKSISPKDILSLFNDNKILA